MALRSQGNPQEAQNLADERQRLADDLAQLQKQMRDGSGISLPTSVPLQTSCATRLAISTPTIPKIASRSSADWLQRGVNAEFAAIPRSKSPPACKT